MNNTSDKMICITDVHFITVPNRDRVYELFEKSPFPTITFFNSENEFVKTESLKVEYIDGIDFINNNGEKICLGMKKSVQEILGLPFEVFKKQREEIEINLITISQLRNRNVLYQKELKSYKEANFLKRLKYLFTGKLHE
jgi:hypothetical protein